MLIPCFGVYTIAHTCTLYGALYQPRLFQFLQVLGNSGLRKPQFLHQVVTDTAVYLHQVLQYRYPRRVPQSLGYIGQFVLLFSKKVSFCRSQLYRFIAILRLKGEPAK